MYICIKLLCVSWWIKSLGKSNGQHPWDLQPLGFCPLDFLRHSIHHDTLLSLSRHCLTVHWKLETGHYILHTIQCALYTVHCALYTEHCTLCTLHWKLNTGYWTLDAGHWTHWTHWTHLNILDTLDTRQETLHIALFPGKSLLSGSARVLAPHRVPAAAAPHWWEAGEFPPVSGAL